MGEGTIIALAIGALFLPDAILISRGLTTETPAPVEQRIETIELEQIDHGKCVSVLITCPAGVCPTPEILKQAQAGSNARPDDVDPITALAKSSGFYQRCNEYYPMAIKMPQRTYYLTEDGRWHHGR